MWWVSASRLQPNPLMSNKDAKQALGSDRNADCGSGRKGTGMTPISFDDKDLIGFAKVNWSDSEVGCQLENWFLDKGAK